MKKNAIELKEQLKEKLEYIETLEKINNNLRKYINEMSGIYKILEALHSLRDLNAIYDLFLEVCNDIILLEGANIYIIKNNNYELVKTKNYELVEKIKNFYNINNEIYEWAFKKANFTVIPHPKNFEESQKEKILNKSFGIAPLLKRNKKIGYIDLVFNIENKEITQNQIGIFNMLISQISLIVDNLLTAEVEKEHFEKIKLLDQMKKNILITASHEFRTPLTIIKGASKIIELKMEANLWQKEDRELYRELIKSINFQVDIMEDIINMMFISIKVNDYTETKKENLNLKNLVEEIIKKYTKKYKNLKFNFDYQDINLYANEEEIKIVVNNLISNACKYADFDSNIYIKIHRKNDSILLTVKNFGQPITQDLKDKIFDLFYRTDYSLTRKKYGIGVGLYGAKKIVEKYNGKIWFESDEKNGTIFYVNFPLNFD